MLIHSIKISQQLNINRIVISVFNDQTNIFTTIPLILNRNEFTRKLFFTTDKEPKLVLNYLINNNIIKIINSELITKTMTLYELQLTQTEKLKLI